MDEVLKRNLELIRYSVLKKDFDGIYCVDGMEGSGKSTLAFQTMKILYPNFCPEDIVFTGKQFLKKVEDAQPKTGIVWDEAGSSASSNEAMNKLQNTIRKKLQVIREKNLFICLVIPYFFGLQTYFAVSRTRFLIHIYTKGFTRGFYEFYNYPSKKLLYYIGKKKHNQYNVVKADFHGVFKKGYIIDEQEYRKRKRELSEETEEDEDTIQNARNRYIINLSDLLEVKKMYVSQRELALIFELQKSQFNHILRSRQ